MGQQLFDSCRRAGFLAAQPLGHPSLGLVLLNNTPGFNIAQAALNLLADVDVVLDVFQ